MRCAVCKDVAEVPVCSQECEKILDVAQYLQGDAVPWVRVDGKVARFPVAPVERGGLLEFWLMRSLWPGMVVEIFWRSQYYRVVVDEVCDRVRVAVPEVDRASAAM